MVIGWTKPMEALTDWDDVEIKAANFNSRALNALFGAVTNEEFKKISSTETAKEAWTILQTTSEGTKAVNDSKLQRLITSFEEIKMEEDELFDEFYAKLKDIVNSALTLGKPFLNPRLWERCSDLYSRYFMSRSPRLRNQRILTKFLSQSWLEICKPMSWVWQG